MVLINAYNKRKYFQDFKCEVLSEKVDNRLLINDFVAMEHGKPLETYLKDQAWPDDISGETRVYLVKDPSGKVVLFFSLKCGLMYKPYQYNELDERKQEFVNLFIEARQRNDEDAITSYYEYDDYEHEEIDRLYNIALDRIALISEGEMLKDDMTALKVSQCFSAIELQHFCKNSSYEPDSKIGIPIGFGVFWEVIVPKICEITKSIGCKYLYLFAANCIEDKSNKLVRYYKNDLKFYDIQDKIIIKPQYDNYCYGLVQKISELKSNREAVWEEFSDVQ